MPPPCQHAARGVAAVFEVLRGAARHLTWFHLRLPSDRQRGASFQGLVGRPRVLFSGLSAEILCPFGLGFGCSGHERVRTFWKPAFERSLGCRCSPVCDLTFRSLRSVFRRAGSLGVDEGQFISFVVVGHALGVVPQKSRLSPGPGDRLLGFFRTLSCF